MPTKSKGRRMRRFEFGEEEIYVRTHWPVGTYKDRRPYTREEIEAITKYVCPRCKAGLVKEIVYNIFERGGESGVSLKCVSCSRRYYPPERKEDARKETIHKKVSSPGPTTASQPA